jgi:hypothetical protein
VAATGLFSKLGDTLRSWSRGPPDFGFIGTTESKATRPALHATLDGIQAEFDFDDAGFPLHIVHNVLYLLDHTESSRYWSVPIMQFLLEWLDSVSESSLDSAMLIAGRGKKLAITVAEVTEAIDQLVYNTDDHHVARAFFRAGGPAIMEERANIAGEMYRREYNAEIAGRITTVKLERSSATRLIEARWPERAERPERPERPSESIRRSSRLSRRLQPPQ